MKALTTGQFLLTTYHPLVTTKPGRLASGRYNLPPFIDGSIRREPDLEHVRPAITCLCRTDRFAPRIGVGDLVAYITAKRSYGGNTPHRRLTAVLQAERRFNSHSEAADSYRDERLDLPNNLLVAGNEPRPIDRSNRSNRNSHLPDPEWQEAWNDEYAERAREHGRVVACRPLFVDVSWAAPIVSDETLVGVFGRVPGTQNPPRFPNDRLLELLAAVGGSTLQGDSD